MEPAQNMTPNQPMNVFSRIVNIFISPAETFQTLAVKPDWITPLILTLAVFLTVGILMKDVIQKEQEKAVREKIMTMSEIADSQKEQVAEMQVGMMKKFWFVGVAIGLVVIGGVFFLGGLFLRLGANKFLGGSVSYPVVLSVLGYSRLIEILATLVKLPAMITKNTMRVDTGLGILVPDASITSMSYTLLSKIDLFTAWQLVVLIIGVSVIYKSARIKSAMLVIGLWLLWILAQTGLAAIGLKFG